MKKNISVVINTKNAAETLEQCLQSVKMLKPEIIVVDMHSIDNTVAIAKKFDAKIFQYEDIGYADPARNFALSKATGDWILVLDADEYIEPKLAHKILDDFTQKDEYDVYSLPRKNIIFGKWIQHSGWWPDYQIRLFKNGFVSWEVGVHKQPLIKGTLHQLNASEDVSIVHNNYLSIEAFIERLQRYTSISAGENTLTAEDFYKEHIAIQSIKTFRAEFFSRFFAHDGIKDKGHGVALALLQSFYQLSTLLKIWQKHGYNDSKYNEKEVVEELDQFAKELNYWVADWYVKHTTGLEKIYWQCKRKYRF